MTDIESYPSLKAAIDRATAEIKAQNKALDSDKPLDSQAGNADPTPSPSNRVDGDAAPTDWAAIEVDYEAGLLGYDPAIGLRPPEADECVDYDGQIVPRLEQFRSRRKRRRSLGRPLETIEDVRAEMAGLYRDFHYGQIASADYTRRVYALDCLARTIRMDIKAGEAAARAVRGR